MNTSLKHTFSERKFDRYSMLIANFFAGVKQQYFIQKCHNLPTCKTSSDSLEFLSICEVAKICTSYEAGLNIQQKSTLSVKESATQPFRSLEPLTCNLLSSNGHSNQSSCA